MNNDGDSSINMGDVFSPSLRDGFLALGDLSAKNVNFSLHLKDEHEQ